MDPVFAIPDATAGEELSHLVFGGVVRQAAGQDPVIARVCGVNLGGGGGREQDREVPVCVHSHAKLKSFEIRSHYGQRFPTVH